WTRPPSDQLSGSSGRAPWSPLIPLDEKRCTGCGGRALLSLYGVRVPWPTRCRCTRFSSPVRHGTDGEWRCGGVDTGSGPETTRGGVEVVARGGEGVGQG